MSTPIKIEKNIAIPARKVNEGKWKGVFESMSIGDSFAICGGRGGGLFHAARKLGVKITSRKQPDGMVRVWKIS